jgi:hypothetical protein
MIDTELATEYVAACQDLIDAEDKVNKLIHETGDASALSDWRHWNPDELPAITDLLRLDRWANGKAIAAALKEWSGKRFAAHKKYGEVMIHAVAEEFLKLPKPDRVDRASLNGWQAYFSASTNM